VELELKAREYLDEHKRPKTSFEIAAVFDYDKEPDYGLGDKVRVADPETGIVTTTRIMTESREYNEQGLTVHLELGQAGFTLAEVISGEKRVAKPLDPLQPTGVYARGIIKGIVVGCNAPKNDWAYTECHVSTAKGFVPGTATLVDKGKQTRFDIPNLDPGVRYYARVVHVDNAGRRSEASQEVSAVAGFVTGAEVEDDSITAAKYKEVRNILPWTGECILDEYHPYEFAFEIPDDTIRIQQIKFSATGERFRSYSQVTEAAEIGLSTTADGGEISTTSVAAGVHSHKSEFVTLSTSETNVNISTTVEISSADAYVGIHDPGHSHSIGAIGGTGPGGEDNHTHTVEVHGAAAWSGTGISASGGYHTHAAVAKSISMDHDHYYTVPIGTTSDGGEHSHQITIPPHAHAINIPPHNHEMVSGIYESSTPDQVFLYFDNGSGYSEFNKVALNTAPDIDTP
ncbi:MAG TPA: hypothetical protein PLZ21_08580, partial [Armatimonadota bacterium]|nr:hypothetical protein [Armatimonadota bacterium]